MKCLLPALVSLLSAFSAATQCPPVVLNCPIAAPVFCDQSDNDALFWNQSYWWDPVHNRHDLAESAFDLSLSVRHDCTDAVSIRYTLHLDLDADGTPETLIDSDSLPGFNTVYFGNAGAGSLNGGAARQFDHRPVQANQKYGFALETSVSGDTLTARVRWHTEEAPDAYVDPQLPLTLGGKHRVVWTIIQGGTILTCDYDFTIRDCLNPDVACINVLSVNIMPAQSITLWFSDYLISAADNTTPADLLTYGIRRAGAGTGFPENPDGTPQASVTFNCLDLGTQAVEIWARDQAGNAAFCEAFALVQDNLLMCAPPSAPAICIDHICSGNPMEDVGIQINGSSPGLPPGLFPLPQTGGDGCAGLGGLAVPGNYTLQPVRDNDPLNGVSTFDLLLINKHILGIEPFTAAWQLLAADANNSRSVTTFDIVEIRKVILGLYQEFPHHQSWGFLPKDAYSQLAPSNPFQHPIPNSAPVSAIPVEFWGYKVGDVNCNALSSSLLEADDRARSALILSDLHLAAGETGETALTLAADADWQGFQLALAYDPALLDLERVQSDVLPGFDGQAFAVPSAGVLTLSWFDAAAHSLRAGEHLLTLRWRARSAVRLAGAVGLQPLRLRPEAYTADDRIQPLELWFASPAADQESIRVFHPQPNPTAGETVLPVWLKSDTRVALMLFDQAGRLLFRQGQTLPAGVHRLSIPPAALPHAGLYSWLVVADGQTYSGKLVRR